MRPSLLQLVSAPTSNTRSGFRVLRCAGRRLAAALLLFGVVGSHALRAEWTEERYSLVAGWNSVWMSIDAGYADFNTLLAAYPQIEEVWMWNSLVSRTQFTGSGETLTAGDAWLVWRRGKPAETTLSKPAPNAAYLVKVASNAGAFQLPLVGHPVPPRVVAQSSGVNFVGFPVPASVTGATNNIERFFLFDPALSATPEVFGYFGGPLSETAPQNPRRIASVRVTALERGKAYWVNSAAFSEYYGPLRISLAGDSADFGSDRAYVTLRVKNVADAADAASVGFTLSRRASATPPAGQAAIAGDVPVLVRGPRDPETQRFTFTALPSGGLSRTLAPGEETELVLGVARSLMTGAAGARYASILQVVDSLGLTRVDLPVSATVPAMSGVWVGAASIEKVDQIIGASRVPAANAPGGYELRLIVHRAANGQTTLLQKVFVDKPTGGVARTVQPNVTTGVSRISSAAFPLDLVQAGTGQLGASGTVVFPVVLAHNAPTNPFLHTYHPDHDGLDARFQSPLPDGRESSTVSRNITLSFDPQVDNGEPGWGTTVIGGTYREAIAGLRAQSIEVSGTFVLRRVSDAAQLTVQP